MLAIINPKSNFLYYRNQVKGDIWDAILAAVATIQNISCEP